MRESVFYARWFLLLTIALPTIAYAAIHIDRNLSILLLPISIGPLIVFYRKDLKEIMQDWYSLIRGRKPERRD